MGIPDRARLQSGTRRLDMQVPPAPTVVQEVRHALGGLGMPQALLDVARLLVSEFLANSIRHAGLTDQDRIRIRANWSGRRLRVDVWDRASVSQRPQRSKPSQPVGAIRPPPGAESGWGLFLVDSLASRWGFACGRYWFELEPKDDERGRHTY